MTGFPWFPLGHILPCGTVGRLRSEGPGWQLLQDRRGDGLILVLAADSPAAADLVAANAEAAFSEAAFASRRYLTMAIRRDAEPATLARWRQLVGPPDAAGIAALASAITALRRRAPQAELASALFVPALTLCLMVREATAPQDLRPLAATLLGADNSSGISSSGPSISPHLSAQDAAALLQALGIDALVAPVAAEDFVLPGRPALQSFFREYIIEPATDRARYQALGVALPNGILLYGPPGSGKTHAVETLVAALRWPCIRLDLGAIGSPFIHQTTVAMRNAFEQASRSAPSLLILEEIDAIASARGPSSGDHKVEELTEILRIIESAAKHNVLVLATTNRRDALDPAILRKGRFDHALLVDYPTREEIALALQAMLQARPHDTPDLAKLATRLTGRPMSDIAWLVNEAARLTARARRGIIGEHDLEQAITRLEGGG